MIKKGPVCTRWGREGSFWLDDQDNPPRWARAGTLQLYHIEKPAFQYKIDSTFAELVGVWILQRMGRVFRVEI
jgi:hypothetical protein